ncbi:MAG: hypothetical protein NWE76_01260 [Candidatus Bathyarchaeota archaeon]|nr:hypothetical protein [Candidatus Bathyarchaeota archaeon]
MSCPTNCTICKDMVLEELRNAQTVDELTFKGTITAGAVAEDGVTLA